tara:strand:+ start:474 stop:659 length:186 start_codon:yes stop_codon:yes gene_type:complete
MNDFTITSAKYVASIIETGTNASIEATINGTVWNVPLVVGNAHYDAIQAWVVEGNTIQPAD